MDIYQEIEVLYQEMLQSGQIEPLESLGRFAGYKHSEESKALIKQWNVDNRDYKRQRTLNQWKEDRGNADLRAMHVGLKQKYGVDNIRHLKSTCKHCGKEGQHIAMLRWHHDKCKLA